MINMKRHVFLSSLIDICSHRDKVYITLYLNLLTYSCSSVLFDFETGNVL